MEARARFKVLSEKRWEAGQAGTMSYILSYDWSSIFSTCNLQAPQNLPTRWSTADNAVVYALRINVPVGLLCLFCWATLSRPGSWFAKRIYSPLSGGNQWPLSTWRQCIHFLRRPVAWPEDHSTTGFKNHTLEFTMTACAQPPTAP